MCAPTANLQLERQRRQTAPRLNYGRDPNTPGHYPATSPFSYFGDYRISAAKSKCSFGHFCYTREMRWLWGCQSLKDFLGQVGQVRGGQDDLHLVVAETGAIQHEGESLFL